MPPGRWVNAQFPVSDVFDFERVILGAKIQVVIAGDDNGAGLDGSQSSFKVAIVGLLAADIPLLPTA